MRRTSICWLHRYDCQFMIETYFHIFVALHKQPNRALSSATPLNNNNNSITFQGYAHIRFHPIPFPLFDEHTQHTHKRAPQRQIQPLISCFIRGRRTKETKQQQKCMRSLSKEIGTEYNRPLLHNTLFHFDVGPSSYMDVILPGPVIAINGKNPFQ